jgi:hypothetical protein
VPSTRLHPVLQESTPTGADQLMENH